MIKEERKQTENKGKQVREKNFKNEKNRKGKKKKGVKL